MHARGNLGKEVRLTVTDGTLLVMGGTQTHYRHQVPAQASVKDIRHNLTLRHVKQVNRDPKKDAFA